MRHTRLCRSLILLCLSQHCEEHFGISNGVFCVLGIGRNGRGAMEGGVAKQQNININNHSVCQFFAYHASFLSGVQVCLGQLSTWQVEHGKLAISSSYNFIPHLPDIRGSHKRACVKDGGFRSPTEGSQSMVEISQRCLVAFSNRIIICNLPLPFVWVCCHFQFTSV
ncbi:hypothetical protein DL98DRAFT_21322 [Cadophora sp. DSE1049]|nr:hypothetical protein DL98DRAFT_21322 [Cadophora sp. DSE1049]